jgi:hypothetical protein
MELSEGLKEQLLSQFKTQKNIDNIIRNSEIYKLSDFPINSIQKIMNQKSQTIFTEINSKKHLTKVSDMIKSYFLNPRTSNYFSIYFQPSLDLKELEKRQKNLENLNLSISDETITELKKLLKVIEPMNHKIHMRYNIVTLSSSIETLLFEKYKVSANLYRKQELQQYLEMNPDESTVIVSDDDLYLEEIPVYTLKEFEKIIKGNIIKSNKLTLIDLIEIIEKFADNTEIIQKSIKKFLNVDLDLDIDLYKLKELLSVDTSAQLKELSDSVSNLDSQIQVINVELKDIIVNKKISLEGNELLELLNSGDVESLQKKVKSDTQELILKREKELLQKYRDAGLKIECLFLQNSYPLEIDSEMRETIEKQIELKNSELELKLVESLGKFPLDEIKKVWNLIYFLDLILGVYRFKNDLKLNYCEITDELNMQNGRNIYIDNAMPISYGVGTNETLFESKLNGEKVSILTGANSGGKTTLLEMFLQAQILFSMGLGIPADLNSKIRLFDEVIYLKKFTGTVGSGAFEQTIRNLIEILDTDSSKLILIDEFEAITEPGAAARILIMFLKDIMKQDSLCIAVSHLGEEINKFINKENIIGIRIDGISANGLDNEGNLITNHQPIFNQLGKSTPELILKRILQDEKFWINKSDKSKELLESVLNK